MELLLIIMRVLHIVFGIIWVGTTIFNVLILEPQLKKLGPAVSGPVMGALMPVISPFMGLSAMVVIISGIVLTLMMMGWSLAGFLSGGWGISLFLGFLATIAATVVGFGIIKPTGQRMASIAASGGDGPPDPETVGQLQQLSGRILTLSRINFGLLLAAAISMAVARFV